MGVSQFGGITRVPQVFKLHALDDAAAVHVEASDNTFRQHVGLRTSKLAKIVQNLQPGLPGFLWMKLHAKDVFPLHRRRKSAAILATRDRRLGNWRAKGMREIHKRRRRHTAQKP